MKIYYTVTYSAVVDADHQDWDDLKEDYGNDKQAFAMASACEDSREFDEDRITITAIEED
jgi:hypothetical protein